MSELDAAIAPAPMRDRRIDVVRDSVADATHEVQKHAEALLPKLEQLVKNLAKHAATSQEC